MADWTLLTIHALGKHPGAWDVLDAGGAPDGLCRPYATAEAAYLAITRAGMAPIREDVGPVAFGPEHDLSTAMRFGRDGGAQAVVLVRVKS